MMSSTAALINDGGAGRFDPGSLSTAYSEQLTKTPGSKCSAPPSFIKAAVLLIIFMIQKQLYTSQGYYRCISGMCLCSLFILYGAQWFGLCGEQKSDFGGGCLELAVVTLSREDLHASLYDCVVFFQEPVNSLMQYAHEGKR